MVYGASGHDEEGGEGGDGGCKNENGKWEGYVTGEKGFPGLQAKCGGF